LPETVSAPSHTEASALPRAPPSPVAPEIAPETEQNPGCRETLEIKSEISIISRKCLDPSAKNSLRISKPHLDPSLVWMFTM
jgi:hypothetical protein